MPDLDLTLIIATYNGQKFLRRAVLSALDEDLPRLEILVVDDGSTDEVLRTVEDLPVVIIKQRDNRGPAAAYNRALRQANGRYITFLDHDDLLSPGGMKARLDWLKKHSEARVLRGVVAGIIDEAGNQLGSFDNLFDGPKEALPGSITREYLTECLKERKPFLCAPWLHVYRSDFLAELGPFDESLRIAHDVEFLLRVLEKGPIPIAPIPTVFYRMHGTNTSGRLLKGTFQANRRTIAESSLVLWSYGFES